MAPLEARNINKSQLIIQKWNSENLIKGFLKGIDFNVCINQTKLEWQRNKIQRADH
jgi:hypothetical protein